MDKKLNLPEYLNCDFPDPCCFNLVETHVPKAGTGRIMTKERLQTLLTTFVLKDGDYVNAVPLYYKVGKDGKGLVRETYWATSRKIPVATPPIIFMRLKRMGQLKPSKEMIAKASWTTPPPTFDEFWNEIISDISKLSDEYRLAFHFTDSKLSKNKAIDPADDSEDDSN